MSFPNRNISKFPVYQKALLTTELEDVFAKAPPAPSAAVHDAHVVKAWEKATGSPSKAPMAEVSEEPSGKRRLPAEEDACPVVRFDLFESFVSLKSY